MLVVAVFVIVVSAVVVVTVVVVIVVVAVVMVAILTTILEAKRFMLLWTAATGEWQQQELGHSRS